MGILKKIFRPVRKIAKKIIPKEVKPFLPYLAAAYFGPQAAKLASTGIFSNPAVTKALIAGTTSAATDEDGNPLRTAALAATPDFLQQGLGKAGKFLNVPTVAPDAVQGASIKGDISGLLTKAADSDLLNVATDPFGQRQGLGQLIDVGKVVGAQTSIDQAAKLAEIQQDEIDKYNENLRKQGVLDKTKRRSAILNIYLNAGYEPSYVNSMLDRYGYESGGRIGFAGGLGIFEDEDILEQISRGYKGSKAALKDMFTKKKKKKEPKKIVGKEGDVYNIYTNEDDEETIRDNEFNDALMRAKEGIEMAYKTPGTAPTPMMKFARGGEVEIEEQVDDLGIMDLMRDQGVEYGEQVSNTQNDQILELLFEKYLEMGLSPKDAAEAAQNEFDRMGKKSDEGIMQMASGYKTDIEEMYEQYVFEMEEQGLQPMSFSQFLAQARSGMADGGEVSIGQIEMLIKRGADNDLIKEYTGAADGVIDQIRDAMERKKNMADGGKVKRRKKGEPADEIIETEEEIFLDKMPRPRRRQGIMEAADGGIMEKDMRGGGFIPEGSKERADDVPARLSKNEFVMTADAVRAAGGGSVNKGAKRMYDMMYNLEGKV